MTSGKGSGNAPPDSVLTKIGGPWVPLQDSARQAIVQANDVNSAGPWQYGPSRTALMSRSQLDNINSGVKTANDPATIQAMLRAMGYSGDVASGNQVNNYAGVGAVNNIANNGIADPTGGNLGNLASGSMAGSGGLDMIRATAGGQYLGANPYLDKQIQAANSDITDQFTGSVIPAIEGRMSMNGRMGSNAEQQMTSEAYKQLGQQLSQNEQTMRGNAYNTERGYQTQAQLALPGAWSGELNTQIGANQANAQDVYSRIQQQLAAASQAHGAQSADVAQALQAGQGLGQNFQNMMMPTDKTGELLAQEQANRQANLTEQSNRFQYGQSAQYDQLQRYLKSLQGIASLGQNNANSAALGPNGPSGSEVAAQNAMQIASMVAMIAML